MLPNPLGPSRSSSRSRPPGGWGSRAAATPGAEMTAPRGGTDEGANGARRSPLAMPVGTAAEGAGAANRAAVPNRGHGEIHRADPECGLVPAAASGAGALSSGAGGTGGPASPQRGSRVVPRECRLGQNPRLQLSLPRRVAGPMRASPPRMRAVWAGRQALQPPLRRPARQSGPAVMTAKRLRFASHREVRKRRTSAPLACSGVSAPSLPGPREPHPRGISQA